MLHGELGAEPEREPALPLAAAAINTPVRPDATLREHDNELLAQTLAGPLLSCMPTTICSEKTRATPKTFEACLAARKGTTGDGSRAEGAAP